MHARVVLLGVGKGVLFREVSSVQRGTLCSKEFFPATNYELSLCCVSRDMRWVGERPAMYI